MKKILGILIVALALIIAIVPLYTDCFANGKTLTTADGRSVPMKCHWTALAEMGPAVPMALAGIFSITSKRKETVRTLGVLGLVLGALVILFPTFLIGVCANPAMPCNVIMKPLLIASGILVMAASAVGLVYSRNLAETRA